MTSVTFYLLQVYAESEWGALQDESFCEVLLEVSVRYG
jgi:hypothetical protein